jgi:hypothetical protein
VRGIGVAYREYAGSVPTRWVVWSGDAAAPAAKIEASASAPELSGTEQGADAFPPINAPGATPMTLDELRRAVRRE